MRFSFGCPVRLSRDFCTTRRRRAGGARLTASASQRRLPIRDPTKAVASTPGLNWQQENSNDDEYESDRIGPSENENAYAKNAGTVKAVMIEGKLLKWSPQSGRGQRPLSAADSAGTSTQPQAHSHLADCVTCTPTHPRRRSKDYTKRCRISDRDEQITSFPRERRN